jgi:Tol biopolymer transport system component
MTPTWAPDSKSLLYISTRDRSYNVWTVPLEGGEPKRLSNGSGRFAVYSPDGSKIAFPSNRLEPGSLYGYNIYIMEPGGETGDRPARQLTHMNGSPGHPTWSPDGKWVAFVSKDVDTTKSVNVGPGMTAKKSELFSLYRLFKIPAAGGRAIQLSGRSAAEEKVEDVWPTWSPDGKWIAVARTDRDKGKNDVWLVDPERGRPAVPITTMGNCSKPTWSADGKAIWFSTFDKGQEDIWVATDLTIPPPPPPPAPKKKAPSFKTVPAKGKP